jgi:hypothetical protein
MPSPFPDKVKSPPRDVNISRSITCGDEFEDFARNEGYELNRANIHACPLTKPWRADGESLGADTKLVGPGPNYGSMHGKGRHVYGFFDSVGTTLQSDNSTIRFCHPSHSPRTLIVDAFSIVFKSLG